MNKDYLEKAMLIENQGEAIQLATRLLSTLRKKGEVGMMAEPNNVTATLKVVVAGEFYDDEATEETLRYLVEQDLEDAGFEVDVSLLKEQEEVKPKKVKGYNPPMYTIYEYECEKCKSPMINKQPFCMGCGQAVKWE